MLTSEQIKEIKEHLEKAQNPIFYYDNDADGLCSFLLFRRFIGRGKGVAARSYPDLNAQYARKARELNADYVFILDKPVLSKEFVDEIDKMGLPLVWIDHHDVEGNNFEKTDNFYIYNPAKNTGKERSEEPVTYWAYKITGRKEDLWIAVMGCVADHFMPDFASEFKEKYGNYWASNVKEPFDVYYKTEIGKIAQAIGFGLKDSTTNIVQLQNFLISCNGPDDIFVETYTNSSFRKRYSEIKKKYDALIERAKKCIDKKMIFFEYGGDLSISSDIANELCFIYPEKYVVVVFKKGAWANVSLRGKDVKKVLDSILKVFVDSSGGGHDDAVGARIKTEDLDRFKNMLDKEINK